jgi:uncharacterized lipoprotein YajG
MRSLASRSLLVASLAALAGCAGAPVPVNYAPSSVMTASGSVAVSDFSYLPAEAKPASPEAAVTAPNQIRNTAMGSILIDKEVRVFVRDAVFSELRLVGVKVADEKRVLTGAIEEFLCDDLGYNIDWTFRVKYRVADKASGQAVYEGTKSVQRRTSKFANAFGALNETVKLNVEELLKDPAFLAAIH